MTVPTSYFDRLYERSADPWGLATRWYESRKYQLTVASLPRQQYHRAFEPGCSVGILSAMLADRCEALLATDAVTDAVITTRDRLAHHAHVEIEQMRVPDQWPTGTFDLIVISEFAYYLTPSELADLVRQSADSLDADGTLVAVHWRHVIEGFALTGDAVHLAFRAHQRLELLAQYEEPDFLLDVFTRSAT
jgi:SAM-dependent methyltransferase